MSEHIPGGQGQNQYNQAQNPIFPDIIQERIRDAKPITLAEPIRTQEAVWRGSGIDGYDVMAEFRLPAHVDKRGEPDREVTLFALRARGYGLDGEKRQDTTVGLACADPPHQHVGREMRAVPQGSITVISSEDVGWLVEQNRAYQPDRSIEELEADADIRDIIDKRTVVVPPGESKVFGRGAWLGRVLVELSNKVNTAAEALHSVPVELADATVIDRRGAHIDSAISLQHFKLTVHRNRVIDFSNQGRNGTTVLYVPPQNP